MNRRNFLKKILRIGTILAVSPHKIIGDFAEKNDYSKRPIKNLEKEISKDLNRTRMEDMALFGEDCKWYVKGTENNSKSKVLMIGDYHEESEEGKYSNLFKNVKKYFDSLAIEQAIYKSEDAFASYYDQLNQITEGGISRDDVVKNSMLTKQILKSGKKLYGIEDYDLALTHGCAVGVYESIARMVLFASKGDLDAVLRYDKEVRKLQDLSPIKFPKYNLEMFRNGQFDGYWKNLIKLITEDYVDQRSDIAAKNMGDHVEERSKEGSFLTGFIYGARHRERFLDGLNQRRVSNLYIGSKIFEEKYDG